MKTLLKTLAILAVLGFAGTVAAQTADQTAPRTWGPGWRHEQMIKAVKDGTFTPGRGFGQGFGMGGGGGPGWGRGGMMQAALGPDGSIDPSKLPEGCPMRAALTK